MIHFPVICIDNFYNNPDEIRDYAMKQDFLESPGNYPGKRTKFLHEIDKDLYEEFSNKIKSIFYIQYQTNYIFNSVFWQVTTLDSNQLSPKNMGFIHTDIEFLAAGVIYLTPNFDRKLGTTFYKQTKDHRLNHSDLITMKKFYSTGEDDNFDEVIVKNNESYEEMFHIENVYNRLIFYDSSIPHSPSHYYMKDKTRLAQVFFVGKIK